LIVFEYQSFFPQPTVTADIPQAVYDLRERDDIRAVFDVPYQHVLGAKEALFLQTVHQYPLIAGQITRQTPVNPAKLAILQATFDPALLREAGADIVIFHKRRATEIDLYDNIQIQISAQLGTPIYADDEIAIYNVPASENTVDEFVALPISGTTPYDSYTELDFFAPESGWIDLTGTLQADNREVELLQNGHPIYRWVVAGETNVRVSIYVPERGYYALRLALNPPCPTRYSDTLACRNLTYDLQANFVSSADFVAATFAEGIILDAATVTVNDMVDVRLLWHFDTPRTVTDIRFVHVVDESGEIAVQSDIPLGDFDSGDTWTETVSFAVSDLPAGEYTVRVGWYDFNTLTNYQVDGQPALELGIITIGNP